MRKSMVCASLMLTTVACGGKPADVTSDVPDGESSAVHNVGAKLDLSMIQQRLRTTG